MIVNAGGAGGGSAKMKLSVATQPTKTTYTAGETIDLTGCVITFGIGGALSTDVTNLCTFSPSAGTAVYEDTTEILVTYVADGTTYTVSIPITVTRVLASLRIDTNPVTNYVAGDLIDLDGLVVSKVFTSGRSEVTTDYTTNVADGTIIYEDTTEVIVSATEGGVTKTASIALTVQRVLQSIAVTTPPTTTTYKSGTTIDTTGMVVTATYNRTSAAVTSYTISPTTAGATEGTQTETVTYTENGVTKTTTFDITIKNLTIVSFASGTESEIKAMLDAYYANELAWEDMGWEVGNTRRIHLGSRSAPNPNSSTTLSAEYVTVVIVAHDHTDLATAINGHTKACITVQFREALGSTSYNGTDGTIYVNGDSSYDTSFTKWSNLYMRTYLNNTLFAAFDSGDFKNAIKPSKHQRLTTNGINPMNTAYNATGSKDGSKSNRATESVTDTLFLPSYPEIFGNVRYDWYLGGGTPNSEEGTQFEYYTTASNRIKYNNNNGASGGNAIYWWQGSASSIYDSSRGYYWCRVYTDGSADYGSGNRASGLAPAFAM